MTLLIITHAPPNLAAAPATGEIKFAAFTPWTINAGMSVVLFKSFDLKYPPHVPPTYSSSIVSNPGFFWDY